MLAAITASGGVLGPVLMLVGLGRVSGLAGSLMLNLEAPFTMLLAVLLFREHLGRSALAGALLIVAGGLLLSWRPGQLHADPLGIAAIAGACLCWKRGQHLDPAAVAARPGRGGQWKTLGAAVCTRRWPGRPAGAAAGQVAAAARCSAA